MKIKKLKYGSKYFESEINNGIIFASDSEVEYKANGSKSINTTITTFFPDIIAKEGYAHLIEHLKAAPIVRKVEKSKYKDKLIVDAATGTNDSSGIKIVLHLKYNFSKYDGLSSRLKTDSKEVKEVLEYMDSIMQEYIENFHLPITQEDINKEIPIILSEREWSSTTVCDDLLD